MHTCTNSCSISRDRKHWARKRFQAEDEDLKVFKLAEWKYCVGLLDTQVRNSKD